MSGSADGLQSSHQLDYYQAMADFKLMFPNMDEEIIEAVLRANGGAVDGTIDQLLTMNTDSDQPANASGISQPPYSARLKRIVELSGRERVISSDTSESSFGNGAASGASFSRSSLGRHGPSKSSAKSSLSSGSGLQCSRTKESPGLSSISTNQSEDLLLLDTTTDDSHVFNSSVDNCDGACGGDGCTPSQSWADDDFLPATPAPPIPPRSPLLTAPPLPPKMSMLGGAAGVSGRSGNSGQLTHEPKKAAKHWDPPMLGKLPDDFLRLDIRPKTHGTCRSSSAVLSKSMLVPHSAHDMQRSRHFGHDTSPLPTIRVRPIRLNSETGQARSPLNAGHGHRSSHDGVISLTRSCDCQRQSSGGQDRFPNSKRHFEIDANTWQMLEDERLALVLQSEEFLAELRQNEDFMRSLEHEHQLHNFGEVVHGTIPEKTSHPEDSAEFRSLLKHIGDTSKKKLIAAAQKFFAKCKKKSQKQILKDTAAPSTLNLLDDDEIENKDAVDENIQFTDEQYKWWSQH